jgi:glyoxylase-like metal-dependent hydrolase (beta-lactamase superfamily II)
MAAVTRRAVVTGALGLAAAAALPRAYAKFGATPLTDGFTLLTGGGGNVLVVATPDGAILVDSGAGDPAAQMLLPTVRELTGNAKVHTLFNTHWHLEQIGGNESVGRSGANIVAHERTRIWQRLSTCPRVTSIDSPSRCPRSQPRAFIRRARRLSAAGASSTAT